MLGARHCLLGQRDGIGHLGLLQPHAHIQAGQQVTLGVGHLGAQRDLAGARVHCQVGKQQFAGERIFAAVLQHHAHDSGFAAPGALELAIGQGTAQFHDLASRLGEVDIHRINLLDHGQLRGFALPHQSAFGDQGAADAARNGRRDAGVIQIDAAGLHGGTACGHVGLGLLLRRHGVGVFLLADRVGGQQWLVALGQRGRLRQVGLGAGQRGLGTLQRRRIGSGVNRKQGLPCLDVAAFAKQPLLQDTGSTGPHLRHARGFQAPGQLGHQTHITRCGHHHAHFGWRHAATGRRRWRLGLATGRQQQYNGQATRRNAQAHTRRGQGRGNNGGSLDIGQGRHGVPWRKRCGKSAE